MVPLSVIERIVVEATLGIPWGDPASRVPQTPEVKEAWDRCTADVAAIQAQGGAVDIP